MKPRGLHHRHPVGNRRGVDHTKYILNCASARGSEWSVGETALVDVCVVRRFSESTRQDADGNAGDAPW